MSALALSLLTLAAWPQEPAPAPFPATEQSRVEAALQSWIAALESTSPRQVELVGSFALEFASVSARVLPEGLLEPLESRLQVVLRLVQDAVEQESRRRILTTGSELNASFEALEATAGADPLRQVGACSELLAGARRSPGLAAGEQREGRSRLMGQPYRLTLPAGLTDAPPLPLLVLLGSAEAAQLAIADLPPGLRGSHALLEIDLSDLRLDEIPKLGRFRFVDALAEVFRQCAVDRDRILLLGSDAGSDHAAVLTALLPHFLQGAALIQPPATGDAPPDQPWRESRDSPWLVRCRGNLGRPELTPVHRGADRTAAFAWLQELARREAYPPEVHFDLLVPGASRAYWVHATAFDPPEQLSRPAWIKVTADRERNALRIESESVHSIDLYLNDRLLDLDQPVWVEHLGSERSYRFQVQRSVATLLENFARNPDPGAVYPAMIRGLDLPAAH